MTPELRAVSRAIRSGRGPLRSGLDHAGGARPRPECHGSRPRDSSLRASSWRDRPGKAWSPTRRNISSSRSTRRGCSDRMSWRACARRSLCAEPVRLRALDLTERIPEYPDRLDNQSREVVRHPGADPTAYHLALRQAETACRLVPNTSDLLSTLGIAQYRAGRYRDALATLIQVRRLRAESQSVADITDLAFMTLSQLQLGQVDEARQSLSRLRHRLEAPAYDRNGPGQALLREAEAVELDVAFPVAPFAP